MDKKAKTQILWLDLTRPSLESMWVLEDYGTIRDRVLESERGFIEVTIETGRYQLINLARVEAIASLPAEEK